MIYFSFISPLEVWNNIWIPVEREQPAPTPPPTLPRIRLYDATTSTDDLYIPAPPKVEPSKISYEILFFESISNNLWNGFLTVSSTCDKIDWNNYTGFTSASFINDRYLTAERAFSLSINHFYCYSCFVASLRNANYRSCRKDWKSKTWLNIKHRFVTRNY